MKAAALLIALLFAASSFPAGSAFAQRDRSDGRQRPGTMSKDERQRMREDMRDVYRERGADRGMRPERPRQLSPEERQKLRQDVQNASKDMRR